MILTVRDSGVADESLASAQQGEYQAEASARFAACPIQTRPELREAAIRIHVYKESVKQVAEAMDVNVQTVYMWRRRVDFQALAAWLVDASLAQQYQEKLTQQEPVDVRQEFDAHAAEMQERLLNIARMTKNEKLQAELAMDWLDRAGFPAKKPVQGGQTFIFGADAMRELAQRAQEAGLGALPLIDLTTEKP